MNRIIKLVLVFVLLFTGAVIHVAAEEIESSSTKYYSTNELIELAKNYIEDYDTNPFKSANGYYLENEIPMYKMNSDDKSTSLIEDTKLYPVFRGEEVIFTIIDMGGTRKISDEGVTGINNTLNVSDTFALVTDGKLCVSLTDKDTTVPVEGSGNERNFVGISTTEEIELVTVSKIGIPYIPSNINTRALELNMPKKAQHTSVTCWAACMASFVHKYKGYNLTSSDVVNDIVDVHPSYSVSGLNNSEQSLLTVKNLLSSVYNISVLRDYTVTDSDMAGIRSSIDAGKASILGWRSASYSGHVTVLSGYSLSGINVIYRIMDPLPVGSGRIYDLNMTNPNFRPSNYSISSGEQYTLEESLTYQ